MKALPLEKLDKRAKRVILKVKGAQGETAPCRVVLDALAREVGSVASEIITTWQEGFALEKGISLTLLLEAAYDESRKLGSPYVGTEHLFLGLVRLTAPRSLRKARRRVRKISSLPQNLLSSYEQSPTPLLDSFGVDLTAIAREGGLDPFVGREELLERLVRILLRKERNNPLLIGDVGVGKTALVRGLATNIARSNVPVPLLNTSVIQFDFGSFVSSFFSKGDSELGLRSLLDEVQTRGPIILFVDDFQSLLGSAPYLGVSSMLTGALKGLLAPGRLQVIGATDAQGYRKNVELDPALSQYFQPLLVPEASEEETERILEVLAPKFESFHSVRYSPEALREATILSKRYISDGFLPEAALSVVDEAGAWVRSQREKTSPEIRSAFRGFSETEKELARAIENQNFDEAVSLRSRRNLLRRRIESIQAGEWERITINKEAIAQIVSRRTGIPVSRLEKDEEEKFRNLEKYLSEKVVGQEQAVRSLARAIRRGRVGIGDPNRPIGSFLFLGPTGVGKTELARALAEFLFGSKERMIRIDMSEFRERHTAARLIGAPPGYVGYGQGGELTEKIRANPYSIVVFDEMEKAHPEVLNLLLQIMEEGELTDGQGRTSNFRNAVIILTSNVGADLIKKGELGFSSEGSEAHEGLKERLLNHLKERVPPEFLNRLSEVIVFRPLDRRDILRIVSLRLEELGQRLRSRGLIVKFTPKVYDILAAEGFSEEYGARALQRVIERRIEAPLSEKIVEGEISEGDTIKVRASGGKIVLEKADVKTDG